MAFFEDFPYEYPVNFLPGRVFHKTLEDYVAAANVPGPGAGSHGTVEARAISFAYLDCGRWGGSNPAKAQKCFGMVWGRWVALCEFRTQGGAAPIVGTSPDATKPMNELLQTLTTEKTSVRIIKYLWSPPDGNAEPDLSEIYVLLPDFHLPAVRSLPSGRQVKRGLLELEEFIWDTDGHHMGRDFYSPATESGGYLNRSLENNEPRSDDEGMITLGSERRLCKNAVDWFNRYTANDIFQLEEFGLSRFLDLLREHKGSRPVHLVQLGDMYELWMGLGRFFFESPTPDVGYRDMRSLTGGNLFPNGDDFVKFWTLRTEKGFPRLFQSFRDTASAVKTSFLWGNHDNYLKIFSSSSDPWVPQRLESIRRGGIFIEHGHRVDSFNRDGAKTGYSITQINFNTNNALRGVDPDRRADFVRGAAEEFVNNPDFAVYAMGHTHAPYLTKVRITRVPVYPPRAG